MNRINTNDFRELCRVILSDTKVDPFAKGYALAGKEMLLEEECRAQIPYLLSNLSHWRGDTARTVKTKLRQMMQR